MAPLPFARSISVRSSCLSARFPRRYGSWILWNFWLTARTTDHEVGALSPKRGPTQPGKQRLRGDVVYTATSEGPMLSHIRSHVCVAKRPSTHTPKTHTTDSSPMVRNVANPWCVNVCAITWGVQWWWCMGVRTAD